MRVLYVRWDTGEEKPRCTPERVADCLICVWGLHGLPIEIRLFSFWRRYWSLFAYQPPSSPQTASFIIWASTATRTAIVCKIGYPALGAAPTGACGAYWGGELKKKKIKRKLKKRSCGKATSWDYTQILLWNHAEIEATTVCLCWL